MMSSKFATCCVTHSAGAASQFAISLAQFVVRYTSQVIFSKQSFLTYKSTQMSNNIFTYLVLKTE